MTVRVLGTEQRKQQHTTVLQFRRSDQIYMQDLGQLNVEAAEFKFVQTKVAESCLLQVKEGSEQQEKRKRHRKRAGGK